MTITPIDKRRPDHAVEISVSRADKDRNPYLLVPVDVPAGTTRITVGYTYPQSETCVVDLGIGDPRLTDFPSAEGHRGWSGGARRWIFIGTDAATPGYLPGPIQPGRWHVILGLYRVPAEPVSVSIEVRFSNEARALFTPAAPIDARRREAGWYRGDLQCHTFHSDAYGAPQHLHATARREGLDFLAVTDHNTTTQQAAYFDAASSPDLVFIPAYEFTTEFGHANIYGAREIFDFRVHNDADVRAMVARIRASGALVSINHDKPTIPWSYDAHDVDCQEVWQTHWLAGNHASLDRYQQRLATGRKITAIGGSDFHQPAVEPPGNPFTLARPCTYLWLDELSVAAILGALRSGKSFVTESPDGPRLVISHGSAGHGGTVDWAENLEVQVAGGQGDVVDIWDATGKIASVNVTADDFSATIPRTNPKLFVRAELVAKASRDRIVGDLLAFLGERRPGHAEYDESLTQPVRRALTSPIYLG